MSDKPSGKKKYYGKFRGSVFDNADPEFRGRIMAMVPEVSSLLPTSWALPCVPMATFQGGTFVVPNIGDAVWIEFEHGDPDYPIWTGGYWSATTVPLFSKLAPPGTPQIIFQTVLGSAFVLSDTPIPPMIAPGVMLLGGPDSYIAVSDAGIQIVAPTVMINGVTVINEGALTVTL
ncbi:MAG TPA: phage baseplate assembly protein V [Candidatus Cybelea sp.]